MSADQSLNSTNQRHGLWWVPTLAFLGAIPFIVAQSLSSVLYKNLGVSNSEITFYTSLLYLPWVIKPLWSPLVDIFKTKRFWVILTQMLIGASLFALSLSLHTSHFFFISLAVLWLIAFASSTHDVAADGFYMLGLAPAERASFIGVRSMFYRIANIIGGGIPTLASDSLFAYTGNWASTWAIVFQVLAFILIALALYHLWALPKPSDDKSILEVHGKQVSVAEVVREFFATFRAFFTKKDIGIALAFILLFRLGESQALKVVSLFMLDPRDKGGLGLSNHDFGLAYSIVGIGFLTLGGLLGGWLISRFGLRKMLWPMMAAVHLPNLAFLFLAYAQPESLTVISAALAVEQFGYGFGFTAFLMVLMMIADGPLKTSHYALCTGFMAAGMMIPGMFSGKLSTFFGYPHFFLWVCLCTIPGFLLTAWIKVDADYGKKSAQETQK